MVTNLANEKLAAMRNMRSPSKTVSTVSLAHALRTHPALIKEGLRILVIDLDPQASTTMYLNHAHAVGSVDAISAQAILQNVSCEEFIVNSGVPGVDVIPPPLKMHLLPQIGMSYVQSIYPIKADTIYCVKILLIN
ncbi:TPA: ParA family protein [Photobacterium damselae]